MSSSWCGHLPRDVGVVLVAAGRGRRAGGDIPKQYQPIAGIPMILHALRPFAAHPDVAQVVVVLPPEDAASPPPCLRDLGGGLRIVAGGVVRAASVSAGLAALDAECTTVLVHDAARPFVQRQIIDAVIELARTGVGAVAAVPLSDSLKQITDGDPTLVARTVPRAGLWRAQTPQGFPRHVLERAHRQPSGAVPATDDAALVEALGVPVRLIPDSPRNFKVTTWADLAIAESLAARPD